MQSRVRYLVVVCCVLHGVFLLGCRPHSQLPVVKNGVIDLRNWGFHEKGNIRLDGQWNFYRDQLLSPEAVQQKDSPRHFISVPGVWNGFTENGQHSAGAGGGTYHLKVLLGSRTEKLGITIPEAGTAYTLYVNNEKICQAGAVGMTPKTSIPLYKSCTKGIGSQYGSMDILVHVSNFHHWQGGLWEPVRLGLERDIMAAREKTLVVDMFLLGAIVIMGLYQLVLFWGRRKNRSPLYFGLFNFTIAVRLLATGDRFWIDLLPGLGYRTEILLSYVSFYLCVPLFVLYARTLFPKEIPRQASGISVALGGIFSVTSLATPAAFFTRFMPLYQYLTLGVVVSGMGAVVLAMVRRRQGAGIFLAGFLILGCTVVNDVLHSRQMISTGYVVPLGLLVFIFSQAFLLSQRFSQAFRTVEEQSTKLEKANDAYVQAEEGLRASEAQYRRLIENSADGICIIRKKVIVFANQRFIDLLGLEADAVIGRSFLPFIHPEDREKIFGRLKAPAAHVGPRGHFSVRGLDGHGQVVFVQLNASQIEWEGKPSIMTIVRDVTEQTRTRELLVQSEKMLSVGGLAAGMAHEINNPLAGMIQSAQLLRNRLSSGIERNEKTARQTGLDLSLVEAYARERGIFTLLENIQTAGQGAADIVSNMLSFARKPDHKKQGCRLETIVDKALALLHNDLGLQYGFNTIKVSKSYDPGLPEICCEETKIRQVLFNLLKNAAQALNAPGDVNDSPAIDIGIHTETDNICLRIKDNGPGMDEAVRKRIFEPFFTTKPVGAGTGLGLSICYFIITEDHGGQLDVVSEPGKGTEFIIRLPLD